MLTNTFGRLATPQAVTLDSFRVEEVLINPTSSMVRVRLSAGVNANDGSYTPVTPAGTFDLTQEGMGTEVSTTLSELVQQLTDLVQAELNNQNEVSIEETPATQVPVVTANSDEVLV